MIKGNVIFIYSHGGIRHESDVELAPYYREYSTRLKASTHQSYDSFYAERDGTVHVFQLQKIMTTTRREYFIYVEF